MSARARDWVREQIRDQGQKLPRLSRLILHVLADHAGKNDDACDLKVSTICMEVGDESTRAVFRFLTPLYDAGLVEKTRRYRDDGGLRSSGYRLLIPAGWTPGALTAPPPASSAVPLVRSAQDPPTGSDTPPPALSAGQEPGTTKNPLLEPTTTPLPPASVNGQAALPGLLSPVRSAKPSKVDHNTDPVFARFWGVYPRKVAKPAAWRAWQTALGRGHDPEQIITAARGYRDDDHRKPDFTAHPSTWLNQERYLDQGAEEPTRIRNRIPEAWRRHR